MTRTGTIATLLVVLATGCTLGLAACGGKAGGNAAGATGPMPTTHLMPTTPGGQPGPVVTEPTEIGSRPISEIADLGENILIEPGSFYPRLLVANIQVPLIWTNLTTSAQQIEFLNSPIRSGPIPPGGKWSYTPPTSLGIHYVDPALQLIGTVDFNGAP